MNSMTKPVDSEVEYLIAKNFLYRMFGVYEGTEVEEVVNVLLEAFVLTKEQIFRLIVSTHPNLKENELNKLTTWKNDPITKRMYYQNEFQTNQ